MHSCKKKTNIYIYILIRIFFKLWEIYSTVQTFEGSNFKSDNKDSKKLYIKKIQFFCTLYSSKNSFHKHIQQHNIHNNKICFLSIKTAYLYNLNYF